MQRRAARLGNETLVYDSLHSTVSNTRWRTPRRYDSEYPHGTLGTVQRSACKGYAVLCELADGRALCGTFRTGGLRMPTEPVGLRAHAGLER